MKSIIRAFGVSVGVFLLALSTFGQGSQRKDRVQAVDGRAMGGQTVITCSYNSASYTLGLYTGTVPCAPSITTYADVALSVPNNIPLLTDSQGNFTYWLTSGNYTECIIGPNVTSLCYAITLGGSGGGTNILPLNNVFTGTTNQFQAISATAITTSALTDQGTSAGGYVCSIAGLFSVAGCPAFPSATPAGPTFSIQAANNGASAFSSFTGLNSQLFGLSIFGGGSNPNFVTLPWSTAMCGPSPWYDAECWGAHARTGFQHTTAIASAGTAVTLASAIDFINGEGIDILAAGAAPSGISAPAAPTVTSPAVSGSTTYHAQCVAIDAHNGLVGGAVATFGTGPASFAATPISNSALTRSTSGLLTITVANSYVANGSTEPTLITISGAVPSDLNGTYVISSANSTTVTAQSAMNEAATETATTAGTSQVWPYLDVTCPNTVSTSVVQYAVYTDTQGSMAYIGTTMPGLGGSASASVIRDWGPTVMAGSATQPPFGIPATPPAASATVNEEYTGTIVSGGGTTSIVVTPALSNAVSGAAATHEDGLALIAAMNAAAANGGGAAYLPPNQQYGISGSYSFNAPLTLPNNVDVYLGGQISIFNTLTVGSFSRFFNAPSSSHTGSSQSANRQYAAVNMLGSPALYFPGDGTGLTGIQLETFDNGEVGALFANNQVTLADINLTTNTNQYAAIPLTFQGATIGNHLTNVNSTTYNAATPGPMIPAIWFKAQGVCAIVCGIPNGIVMDGINSFAGRGMLVDSGLGAGSQSQQGYRFYVQEVQSPSTPVLMFYGPTFATNVHLTDAIMDSTPVPGLANWGQIQNVTVDSINTTAGVCAVTGNPIRGLTAITPSCSGQNIMARTTLDSSFRISSATNSTNGIVSYTAGLPDIHSSLVESPLAWAYPTPQITATTTSGSIAPGTYNVAMAIRGFNGGDSALSNVVVVTLGSTGGITATCSNCGSLPANKGFDFYLNQKGQTGNPFVSSTQTFTTATINENEAFLDGTGLPLFDATGIYGFNILDTDLISSGLSSVCATAGGVLTISGCTVGTGTVTNPSGNFTLGYPATSANATTGIAASPIYIDADQFTGADFSAQIQNALAGCVSANAGCAVHAEATVTAGGSATGTVNPLANVTTTGSANIDLYLPCAQMLTNVQWYSPASDVRVHGCGLHSGVSVIQASASFPASTPIIRIGDGTHAPFRSYYDGVRIACGSAPSTCTGFLGNLLQERAGLYQDAIYGANSSTATSPLIKCLGCTHEAFIDLELLQYGANDGLLLDGNNVIQLAQGKVDNITCNNTGFNQGATCVHIQDTGASGATYYNTKVSLIHGENVATVVSFDSQSDGEVDTADCSANCSTVLVRNTTGYVHQVNIGTQAIGVTQYSDLTSGVTIGITNFQRVASGTAGSAANLMSGTIWPTIAKTSGYTLGYGDEQVTFTGTINITVPAALPATGTAKRWLVINDGSGTGTVACSSGNINGSGTLALTANQSAWLTSDGVNCFAVSGGSSIGTALQYQLAYWSSTTNIAGACTPPATNGIFVAEYQVTSSAALPPTCPQLGFGGRSITSTTSTDTVLYSDVASVINHDVGASNASTETLPTATTLLNPAFSFVYTNHSAFLDTITATTWTIQLNGAAATSSISVPSGASVRIKVDPNSATLWDADCSLCQVNTFATLTDAATVTWAIGKQPNANASLTFTVHSGSRTLNITNPVAGGNYVVKIIQDATGGEGLTLGTGCTWKVIGGGSGAVTPSTGANALDILAFTFDGTNCLANYGKNYN